MDGRSRIPALLVIAGLAVLPLLRAAIPPCVAAPRAEEGGKGVPAAEKPAEKPVENVSDEKAKEALETFRKEFAKEDLGFRIDALKRVGRVVHPTIADRLCELAFKDGEARLRTEALRGLGLQKTSAKVVGPRVARFLSDAAEENRKKKARGDYGVRVDPKTGNVDTDSPEGKEALRTKRERGALLAEAVRVLEAAGFRGPDGVDSLREFLQDGNDDLVVLSMGTFAKWKEWGVLQPDFLQLFEMYPKETEVNVGGTSVDTGAAGGADAAAARRAWMAKYGDPDKRRPRPLVVKALKKAILDITGETVESPEAFRELLKRPDVKRKVRAGR